MKLTLIVGFVAASAVLAAPTNAAPEKDDFNPGKLLADFGKSLELPKDDRGKVGDVLEEKGKGLQTLIDKEVDKGLLRVESIGKEFSGIVDDVKQNLDDVLSDKQVQDIVNFLERMEKDTVGTIRQEIITELSDRLNLTKEQLDKAGGILEKEIAEGGKLLDEFLKKGANAYEEFAARNEQQRDQMNNVLDDILKPGQMQELKKWQSEISKKVQGLFALLK